MTTEEKIERIRAIDKETLKIEELIKMMLSTEFDAVIFKSSSNPVQQIEINGEYVDKIKTDVVGVFEEAKLKLIDVAKNLMKQDKR